MVWIDFPSEKAFAGPSSGTLSLESASEGKPYSIARSTSNFQNATSVGLGSADFESHLGQDDKPAGPNDASSLASYVDPANDASLGEGLKKLASREHQDNAPPPYSDADRIRWNGSIAGENSGKAPGCQIWACEIPHVSTYCPESITYSYFSML